MNRIHMKFRHLAVIAGIALFPVFAAQAHHSDAMFDRAQVRELSGVVKEFQFTNPHTWVQLNVTGDDGKMVEWSFEWGSPNQLGRQGIRPSTFPAGAEVTIRTNPMRDGTPGGAFIGARFADGTTIGRWD
jgi:hypothetical protein